MVPEVVEGVLVAVVAVVEVAEGVAGRELVEGLATAVRLGDVG